MTAPRGLFITFEGGEGTGKSTQARLLAAALTTGGREVLLTREPGGSPGAEEIRELLVSGAQDRWPPLAETLLFYAARADHLERVIRPALTDGKVVICDRFSDSTRAYQGAARRGDPALIDLLDKTVVGATQPDLTLVLDLPVEEGLSRAASRGGAARFESFDSDFHARLRAAYLAIAKANPSRCAVIDAQGTPDTVHARITAAVTQRLKGVRLG